MARNDLVALLLGVFVGSWAYLVCRAAAWACAKYVSPGDTDTARAIGAGAAGWIGLALVVSVLVWTRYTK